MSVHYEDQASLVVREPSLPRPVHYGDQASISLYIMRMKPVKACAL